MRLSERNWRRKFGSYCLKRRVSYLSERDRPSGIIVLVILEILLGVLLLLGAVGRYERASAHEEAAVIMIILAALSFCFAFGLWIGKTWAWIGSIGLAVLGIILSVFILFIRPTLGEGVYLIANTVMIYFLIQPRVQRHFGHNRV
jgi:lysylphosphatidylglycerol synthetase-like protein (DUF2156 family)